jgi:hypothetical protein
MRARAAARARTRIRTNLWNVGTTAFGDVVLRLALLQQSEVLRHCGRDQKRACTEAGLGCAELCDRVRRLPAVGRREIRKHIAHILALLFLLYSWSNIW